MYFCPLPLTIPHLLPILNTPEGGQAAVSGCRAVCAEENDLSQLHSPELQGSEPAAGSSSVRASRQTHLVPGQLEQRSQQNVSPVGIYRLWWCSHIDGWMMMDCECFMKVMHV